MAEPITLTAAFIAGLGSFFFPCILPLLPAYISYLSGTSLEELEQKKSRKLQLNIFKNSVFFVIGFSAVFILMGFVLGSVGAFAGALRILISRIGGIIIIIFGLHMLKLVKIPFLETEHKVRIKKNKSSTFGSTIIGASFGAGWTPCVGPILIAILGLAALGGSGVEGAALLGVYSIGLAIPFLLTGLFTSTIARFIQKANKYFGIIDIIAGVLLIILGIMVFTNTFERLIGFFTFGMI